MDPANFYDQTQYALNHFAPLPQSPTVSSLGGQTADPIGLNLGGAVKTAGAVVGAPLISQLVQELYYQTNARFPSNIPTLDELFRLSYAQLITPDKFAKFASMYGAQLGLEPSQTKEQVTGRIISGNPEKHALWRAVLRVNSPSYDVGFLRKLMRQGVSGAEGQLRYALRKRGFAQREQQDLFINEWEMLGVPALLQLFFRRVITSEQLDAELLKLGYRAEEASRIKRLAYRWLPTSLALGLANLGVVPTEQIDEYLKADGWWLDEERTRIKLTRFAPPSVLNVLASGRRGTWNDIFATKWGLDDDQPPQTREWLKRLGLDYSAGTDAYGTTGSDIYTWAKAAWRDSARLPDLGMLAAIIHRFRGDPSVASTWSQPGYPPLRQDEIWDVLRANGLPTLSRNYWGRLVYSPISMRLLRTMIQFGGYGPADVAGALMDNGLSPADAAKVAPAIIASTVKSSSGPIEALTLATAKRIVKDIEAAYGVGTLTHGQAAAELVAQAVPAPLAATILAAVDLEEATSLAKQLVARTRSEYYGGRITAQQAVQRLTGAQLDPARVTKIIAAWTAAFTERRRQLATNQVLRLLRQGLLSAADALGRLSNLGWSKPDEVLLLKEVQGQVDRDKAAAVKALEAKASGEERKIVATLRGMGSTVGKLLGRLKTITPVSSILKWYKDGLWTEGQVRDRLGLLGYPSDVIDTMLLAELGLPAGSPIPETAPVKGK